MRLLAAAPPSATGRVTEGLAVVGDITLEGTLALVTFGALPLAFVAAAIGSSTGSAMSAGRSAAVARRGP